jgi:Holliday junction resolvasome RuvABC endonuclease subunit
MSDSESVIDLTGSADGVDLFQTSYILSLDPAPLNMGYVVIESSTKTVVLAGHTQANPVPFDALLVVTAIEHFLKTVLKRFPLTALVVEKQINGVSPGGHVFSVLKNKAVEVAILMFGVTNGIECFSILPDKGVKSALGEYPHSCLLDQKVFINGCSACPMGKLARKDKKKIAVIYWNALLRGTLGEYSIAPGVIVGEGKVDDIADAFLQAIYHLLREVRG